MLTLFSCIEQKTGEDWDDVRLSLCNALPVTSTVLPEMLGWYLRPPVVMPTEVMAGGEYGMMMSSAPPDAVADFESLDDTTDYETLAVHKTQAGYAQSERRELPIAFEYDVPQHTSIGSGDQQSLIPLSNKQLDGKFFHYAVPAVDTLPYLVCRTAGDSSMMTGRLNIHFGGRFVGGTRLTEKKPGE
ncbi:MAG: DUF4139 domain-containing protein, partial [Bacteroidetes bacterium]|nr:DUF4139 domain-containing protein [Bacteroidota bacterium]